MRLVSWKDEYSVGIDSIDDEHRQLIETINRLHEELDSPDRKRTVLGFFKRLMVEIKTHFVHEEQFMREHDYKDYSAHKQDHDLLLAELSDIMEAFQRSVEVDSVDLSMRLDAWFFRHFHHYDTRLHQALGPD
jgi:hemerythrin